MEEESLLCPARWAVSVVHPAPVRGDRARPSRRAGAGPCRVVDPGKAKGFQERFFLYLLEVGFKIEVIRDGDVSADEEAAKVNRERQGCPRRAQVKTITFIGRMRGYDRAPA